VSGSLRRTTTLLLYSTISCVFIIISSTVQYNILYTCILHIWYSEPSLFPRLVRIHSRGSVLIFHRKHAATNIFSRALLCILYNNIHIYTVLVCSIYHDRTCGHLHKLPPSTPWCVHLPVHECDFVRQRSGVIYYDVQENRTGRTDQDNGFSCIERMNIDDGFKLF